MADVNRDNISTLQYLVDWVSDNPLRFSRSGDLEKWGIINHVDGHQRLYIDKKVFVDKMSEGLRSCKSFFTWATTKGLLITGDNRLSTVARIQGRPVRAVCILLDKATKLLKSDLSEGNPSSIFSTTFIENTAKRLAVKYINVPCYVYFITDGTNAVKIGVAKDIQKRLVQIQVDNPRQLHVLYQIECVSERHAFDVENELHKTYGEYHLQGEWFSIKDKLLEEDKA
jgi:hypothetical protein